MTPAFFGLAVFLFGLIVGSFLNVCIYRLPREESLVYPPSHCPKCYQPIRPDDNIPVISWFLLRGRCRSCGERISLVYPAVEFATAVLFLAYYWRLVGFAYAPTPQYIGIYAVHMAFLCALLVSTVIDFRFYIIPDEISVPGAVIGILASFALPDMHSSVILRSHPHVSSLIASLLGAAVGAGIIYGIGVAGKLILRKEAMGFGDVKLMAMIGGILGWELTVFVLLLSALLGTVYGLIQMAFTGDNKIPYGPFLSIAAAVTLFFRSEVGGFITSVILSYRLLLR